MAVNEITASRAEYALALTALGLRVSSFIPERIVPPIIVQVFDTHLDFLSALSTIFCSVSI